MVVFVIPILLCALFVLYIDPFNYFSLLTGIPEGIKKETVSNFNDVLWYTIDYAHAPSPGIIIGDSRSKRISVEHLREKTGRQYKHLCGNAVKINEIVDFFWFANSYKKLESVYIVLTFSIYNLYAFANRVVGAEAAIKNPLLYVFDRHVIEASYLVFSSVFLKRNISLWEPPASKEEFWKWSLDNWSNQQYGKWKYPLNGYKGLRDISDYCRQNHIELTFIIAPNHTDFQAKVDYFNLNGEQIRFKKDISALSTTYDFDYVNDLTKNKDNFSDPVHVTEEVANSLVDEILTGNLHYGRLLTNP